MPQQAKAPHRRQRSGGAELELVQGKQVDVPDPPKGLLKSTRDEWTALWQTDVAQVWLPEHMAGIRRLFSLYDQRERALKCFKAEPEVMGSTGQPKLSHFAAEIASLDQRIIQLEDRYGLSPKSKVSLGLEYLRAQAAQSDARSTFSDEGADDEDDPRTYDDVGPAQEAQE